jgi:hypothetical protein
MKSRNYRKTAILGTAHTHTHTHTYTHTHFGNY